MTNINGVLVQIKSNKREGKKHLAQGWDKRRLKGAHTTRRKKKVMSYVAPCTERWTLNVVRWTLYVVRCRKIKNYCWHHPSFVLHPHYLEWLYAWSRLVARRTRLTIIIFLPHEKESMLRITTASKLVARFWYALLNKLIISSSSRLLEYKLFELEEHLCYHY